ncbi:LysR family transcriptional regulator [Pseudomonas citronellolis]|uniref:LysR family transcriptional regulator n=1 Tax=Pseudomonas citronellolis TaxID=53408 RepID=UPI000778D117|nr:LysR family transcriptional regulator [Pseudomonas citronellolis]AMO76079.1 HTH-type transcriptional activator AllS [Pseudomonas citronellolis]
MSAPSLDQLRVLAEVVDCGSFSAAARRLERTQPVISYTIANLEAQLGLTLFERGKRRPILTENGEVVLAYARRMCLLADELRAGVESLGRGLEGEVSLAVDVLYPVERLATLLGRFAVEFPGVALRIESGPLGRVLQLVESRTCVLGISGLFHDWPDDIEPRDFGYLQMVPVAAPDHPLAVYSKAPSMAVLREHLQLILDDSSGLTHGWPLAISGVRTWRVTDLDTKLALLRSGFGWGHMPLHRVEEDLQQGRLVRLKAPIRQLGTQSFTLIHRVDTPPGQAGGYLAQLLIEHG